MNERGLILPAVLLVLFLLAVMQLRIERNLWRLGSAAAARADSIRAGIAAKNRALLGGSADERSVRRLAQKPLRIDVESYHARFGRAEKSYSIYYLSNRDLSGAETALLPRWSRIEDQFGGVDCPVDQNGGYLSARTCRVTGVLHSNLLHGNLIGAGSLRIEHNNQTTVVGVWGDITLEELRIEPGSSQIEILAIGDLKIGSIRSGPEAMKPINLLLLSTRGSVEVSSGDGLELCQGDSGRAVRLTLQSTGPAVVGGRQLIEAGQVGCPYDLPPDGFERRRIIGAAPE